jgi:signal transduction histidine kinase/HAMP domain-containing protein
VPWMPSRRQTIGSRIFAGYGVIMALAMGFMLIIVSLLLSANARQVEALERWQRLETNAVRLNLALQQEESSVRGYLLRGEEKYLEPYRDAILLHQAALDELQQLVLTPADREALEAVRASYRDFLIGANQQIDTYREESKERSIALWETDGQKRAEALQAAIKAFVRIHRQAIDGIVSDAEERRQSILVLMTVLFIVAGISVILSGRRITRSITDPVGRLVAVASAFSQGHLDQRAPIQTRDELATLARVMNEMAGNLAHSRSAFQAALRQTEERNRQLATLNSLAGTLSQSLDLRFILDRALDHVLAISGTERGWVWLLDGDHLADAPLVTRRLSPEELDELQRPAQRAYLLAVARQGEVISKEQPSPLAHGTPDGGPTGRSLLVPLATRDRALGLMALSGRDARRVEAAGLELMQAIGRQIAVGIENARLFAAEQRLTREALGLADTARLVSGALELDESLPIIARSGVALLNVDRCIIFLYQEHRHGWVGIYHYGLTEAQAVLLQERSGVIEEIARRYAPAIACLSIPDAAAEERDDIREVLAWLGARSALGVSLRARGQPLGVLYFDTVERARQFSAHDQRVAVALADQAAIGIERALLYAGVQERASQLAGLYEIGKVIAATLDQEELYEVLYRETRRLMDADAFKVSLYGAAEGIQRIVYRVDGEQRLPTETLPAEAGLTGYVMRTRRSLLASRDEVEALGIQLLRSTTPDRATRSLLCVPMTREDQVLGAIATQSYRANAYSPQHLELFEAIANQAAIAIENAQLHRRALDLAVVEERNRLARELHDSVTQMLFSITLTLQAGRVLLQRNPAQAEQQIDKAQQTAQEALAEMRALIYQLRPASMRDRGLVGALSSYVDAYRQRTGLEVTFQHEGEALLTDAQEQALFRIAQEALNNVFKHAEARQVQVRLICEPSAVTLAVRDDGKGLPAAAPRKATTWGLTGMRERAEVLGGTFAIESSDGGGTLVQVRLPVAAEPLVTANGKREAAAWSPSE